MPEFEENEDAAKNAPYTYEPSRSSAAELGELAGVVITPGETKKTPTKSRWGKPADQESSGGIADDVPAGEVDLSKVSDITDDLMKKGGASNRAPREDNRREERNSGSRSERPRRRSRDGEGRGERRRRSSDGERTERPQGERKERSQSDRSEGRRRNRRRSDRQENKGSTDKPTNQKAGTEREPVKVSQEEPETFSDKIVGFVKKMFGGSPAQSENKEEKRSFSRGESRSGSSQRRRRRRSGNRGSSGEGRSGDGQRRSRQPRGDSSDQSSGDHQSSNSNRNRRRRRRRRSGGGENGPKSEASSS